MIIRQCSFEIMHKATDKNFQFIKDYFTYEIKLNPKDAKNYNNRGVANSMLGNQRRAIDDFTKAIQINDKDDAYYHNRAYNYYKIGQLKLAINDENEAIRLDPMNSAAYNTRGAAYTSYNDNNKNLYIISFLRMDTNRYQIVYQGTDEGSAKQTINTLQPLPFTTQYIFQQVTFGNIELALQDFKQAIALNPNCLDAYTNRAYINLILGHYHLALQDINEVLKLDPKLIRAYQLRCEIYTRIYEHELAMKDLPYINDIAKREFIVNFLCSINSSLNKKTILEKTVKLNALMNTYQLNFEDIQFLRSTDEGMRVWLTQIWRQLVKRKDINGNPVDIKTEELPAELWEHISTFAIGHNEPKRIRDTVNKKLCNDIKEKYAVSVGEKFINATCCFFPFLAKSTEEIKKKEKLVETADRRCQKRMSF